MEFPLRARIDLPNLTAIILSSFTPASPLIVRLCVTYITPVANVHADFMHFSCRFTLML